MRSHLWRLVVRVAAVSLMVSATCAAGRTSAPAFPGDAAFTAIDYSSAMKSYDSVVAAHPQDTDALWRLARLEVCIGDTVPSSERERHYRSAAGYARRCLALDSTVGQAHSWLAAALGNIAMYEGSSEKVRLCDSIKRELDRALAYDAADDLAYSILGSFYRALGKVSWFERTLANLLYGSLPPGGFVESEGALKQAIRLSPTMMRHHFELALLYRDWGREEEANGELRLVLDCPVHVAGDRSILLRARELMGGMPATR